MFNMLVFLLLIHCATVQNEPMRAGFHAFEGLISQGMCIHRKNQLLWSVVTASTHCREKQDLSLNLHQSISSTGETLWPGRMIFENYQNQLVQIHQSMPNLPLCASNLCCTKMQQDPNCCDNWSFSKSTLLVCIGCTWFYNLANFWKPSSMKP